jgi:hypothetical protein
MEQTRKLPSGHKMFYRSLKPPNLGRMLPTRDNKGRESGETFFEADQTRLVHLGTVVHSATVPRITEGVQEAGGIIEDL